MDFDVVVVVPGLEVAEVDLHHADAALDQAPRHQAAAAEVAIAVALAHVFAARCVMSNASGASVCMRKAISADWMRRLELRIGARLLPGACDSAAASRSSSPRCSLARQISDCECSGSASRVRLLGIDVGALVHRGQKRRTPQLMARPPASPGHSTTKPGRFWFSVPSP